MRKTSWLTGFVFAALAIGVLPQGPVGTLLAPVAAAQNVGMRTVSGAVLNANSEAVSGAVVFLQSQKTKTIRSYTTTQNGRFYFAQVSMTIDYNLWAEKDGKKSDVKTVSSWDTRKDFQVELRIK